MTQPTAPEGSRSADDPVAALRASEERYRLLFEASRDAVLVVDRDCLEIVDANTSAEELYGWPRAQLIGMSATELSTEPDATAGAIRGSPEVPVQVRRRHRRLDGSSFEAEITYGALVVDDRSLVVAVIRDVTARARSEAEFRALIANSTDIITVLEPDGSWRFSSQAGQRILGYPPDYDPPHLIFDLLHPDDLSAAIEAFEGVVAGTRGPNDSILSRVRAADGSLRYLETVATNLIDDPAVRGVVLNSSDVTERVVAEDALRESERRFRALVQRSTDLVTVARADSELIYVSPSVEQILGYTPDELVGTSSLAILHPDDVDRVTEAVTAHVAGGAEPPLLVFRARHKDGSWRTLEGVTTNLLEEPTVQGVVSNSRDVTDRREAERTAAELIEVLEASDEIVVLSDPAGNVVYANHAARTLVDARNGQHVGDLSSPTSRDRLRTEIMPSVRRRGVWSGELEMVGSGGVLPVAATVQAHYDENGSIIRIATIAHDISELKAAQQRLEYEAMHDLLTGLPNRAMFREIGERALARAARTGDLVSVLFLDLDGFKLVNDSFGHDAGDRLLAQVARRLRDTVRLGDTVARLGGDEFVILCEQPHSRDRAIELSHRLIDVVSEPFVIEHAEVGVGASIGVAHAANTDATIGQLIREADIALYQAKHNGRGRSEVFDDSTLHQELGSPASGEPAFGLAEKVAAHRQAAIEQLTRDGLSVPDAQE